MITQKNQNQMTDYLVRKLEESYEIVNPRRRVLDEDVNCILLNHSSGHCYGIVLLVDKEYPDGVFNRIYNKLMAESGGETGVGVIIYKDGKTFFRTAAPHCYSTIYSKKDHKIISRIKKPLKFYSNEDIHKMIRFRPEEEFLFTKHNHLLQYYQPESENLREGIVTCDFAMVRPDYGHISSEKFQPKIDAYRKDHIWKERYYNNDGLILDGKLLVQKKKV